MNSQVISTQTHSDIKIFILEGETVESLLQDFVERSRQTLDEDQLNKLQIRVSSLVSLVRTVSPSQVKDNNAKELTDQAKLTISVLGNKQSAIDDFFNTLNLCVVGLGTRLRRNLA